MANADAPIPKFKAYAEREPIPPVDPEDLKRRWNLKPPWTAEAMRAAWSREADSSAVSRGDGMVRTLVIHKLLEPWQHGGELDDAVFRVAATFLRRHEWCLVRCAVSARRRSARYRFDFPLPFEPVMTLSFPSGTTRSRNDR